MRSRGTPGRPPNRFETLRYERGPVPWSPRTPLEAELADLGDPDEEPADPRTEWLEDPSRSIVATNQSPDVGFDASVNPYRGCEHGCVYCFARPTHEYLGFSSGLDFETKILVKPAAAELLRKRLASPIWKPQVIGLSGVTDCYQPAERRLRLTRGCLEVLAAFRNPVSIVTKSFLVTRDVDLLAELAASQAVSVCVSVTSLDAKLQRVMEPRASAPSRRLAAIERLARADVPVGLLLGPVIPGLNDHEIPKLVRAAADAGAGFASNVVLRLPHAVEPLFVEWLERHFPERKAKVLGRIRDVRGGRLSDPRFHARQRGEGRYAAQLEQWFRLARRRAGLADRGPTLSTAGFRRPGETAQLGLFGSGEPESPGPSR